MKKFFAEFKDFAMKGNVVDLAVGVIIGAAFGKIITSIVNDLLMPLLGIVSGQVSFSNLVLQVGAAQIRYGTFLQTVLDFILIALSIFVFVKGINKARKKLESKEEAIEEAKVSDEVVLLSEIRDLLKSKEK
ncbi:MAG: large-conductance mechanosensitive channel protein MscL [Bacillota bacterium]